MGNGMKYETEVRRIGKNFLQHLKSLVVKLTFVKDQKSNGKVAWKKESLQLDVPIKGLL